MSRRDRLGELLAGGTTTPAAGVWDTLSARIAEDAGWPLVHISGAAVANTTIGRTDLGYMTQTEVVETAARIVDAVQVPVIGDADDGFGNPLHVTRTVQLMERAGLAAIHLEDLAMPKRCVLLGKGGLGDPDYMVRKVQAAVAARSDPGFRLIARTDNYEGADEAIRRGKLYAAAGADLVLIIGLTSVEEMRRASAEIPVPLVDVQVKGAVSPYLSPRTLTDIGIGIAFYPTMMYGPSYYAARSAAATARIAWDAQSDDVPDMPSGVEALIDFEDIMGLSADAELQSRFLFSEAK